MTIMRQGEKVNYPIEFWPRDGALGGTSGGLRPRSTHILLIPGLKEDIVEVTVRGNKRRLTNEYINGDPVCERNNITWLASKER